jgi:hemolysin type calcium-binding protein
MDSILYVTIIAFASLSSFNFCENVFAIELKSTDSLTSNFSNNLKSKIHNLISDALNGTNISSNTDNTINTSSQLTNGSSLISSQVVISSSKSKIVSNNTSSTNDSKSTIKNQVITKNGVCSSEKVGGNGNDTLSSIGKCNDELTGGPGADKFTCGEGNDTIRDYNPKEGDIILDRPNCEKIL